MRSGKVTGAWVVGWWVAPVLVLAMGLATQARAASQAQEPSAGQALTLDKLRQKTGIAWERRVTKKSGERAVVQELARAYPARRGQGLETPESASDRPIDPKDAEARALRFATSHSALLVGGADGVSLPRANLAVREVIAKTYPPRNQDRGTDYTVVLAQLHRNVPVFEAELRISVTQFGEIWSVINGFAVIADPPVVAKLTRDEAIAQARKLLGNPTASPEAAPDLCIYPASSLAWHMNFVAPDFQEILIDATSGAVLLARKNVRDACSVTLTVRGTGTAWAYRTCKDSMSLGCCWPGRRPPTPLVARPTPQARPAWPSAARN